MIKVGDKLLCIDANVVFRWQYYQSHGVWVPFKGRTYTVSYVLYSDGVLDQFSVEEIGSTFIEGSSLKCFITKKEQRRLKVKRLIDDTE